MRPAGRTLADRTTQYNASFVGRADMSRDEKAERPSREERIALLGHCSKCGEPGDELFSEAVEPAGPAVLGGG
jgi:hypothetical protein